MKVIRIQVYLNGLKLKEYYETQPIELCSILPKIKENKIYKMHYLMKMNQKIYPTEIVNFHLFQEDGVYYMLENINPKYCKFASEYLISPNNRNFKLVIEEEQNHKLYFIWLNEELEIMILSNQMINILEELEKKIPNRKISVKEINTYGTCSVNHYYDVIEFGDVNKISISIDCNENKKIKFPKWLHRLISS